MKKTTKLLKPLLGIIAAFFFLITFAICAFAAQDDPNLWTVQDEDCTTWTETNGVRTETSGIIRHCYPMDREQCNSHSCQSTNPT